MMEAVARRKAHWLFGAGSEKAFSGKRRPQEDMVTSAVFGSSRLLPQENRHRALALLLGQDCWHISGFKPDADIVIHLWQRLKLEGRRDVEPDILLVCDDKTVIVEAKWKTDPAPGQLDAQIAAVAACEGLPTCAALLLLGHSETGDQLSGPPRFSRTWRDVSGDLQKWKGKADTPLSRWVTTMSAFLQETDMGRVFNGLPRQEPVETTSYKLSKPGHPPWLDVLPAMVGSVHYTFGEKKP